MEYQEFKIMIQERMQEMMGESVEVRIENIHKNSQSAVEALTFQEKHSASKIVFSLAIHLLDTYKLYILNGDGEELADRLHQIQRLYEEQEPKSIENFPADWDVVKETISVNPIFMKWNQERLCVGEVPFRKYLDFAVILRRALKVTSRGSASMVVNRELLSYMEVSEEVRLHTHTKERPDAGYTNPPCIHRKTCKIVCLCDEQCGTFCKMCRKGFTDQGKASVYRQYLCHPR